MGCLPSKFQQKRHQGKRKSKDRIAIKEWRSGTPLTPDQLHARREEFWDTQPHYGGDKIIWETLRAVVEADMEMKPVIIESAGLIQASNDLTVFYDAKGWKYELPHYVISDPANLMQ